MFRTLSERFPFLMFIETPAGSEGGGGAATEGAEVPKTFTQDEVNAFLAKELGPLRQQIKDLKPAAEKLAQIEESQKTELEKVLARAEEAEKKVAKFESDAARSALVDTISTEKNLDAKAKALLAKSGITDETALRDYAGELSSVITTAPQIPTPLFGGGSADGKNGISGSEAAARAAATALLKKSRS